MKTSTKIAFAVVILTMAGLCVSSTSGHRGTNPNREPAHDVYRLNEIASFESIDVEKRGGEIIGVTLLQKGRGRIPLRQDTNATCPTTCPEGQKLSCWADEKQSTSICFCDGSTSARKAGKAYLKFQFDL